MADLVFLRGATEHTYISDDVFGWPAWYVRAVATPFGWVAAGPVAVGDEPAPQRTSVMVLSSTGARWRHMDEPAGTQPVAIVLLASGALRVIWALAGGTQIGAVTLDAETLTPLGPVETLPGRVVGSSQGFLDITDQGNPVWTDDERWIDSGGQRVYLPMLRRGWLMGQGGPGLTARVLETGQWYDVTALQTQVPSRLAVSDDGAPAVLVGGHNVVVPFSAFTPHVEPTWVDEPPVEVPDVHEHHVELVIFDEPGAPQDGMAYVTVHGADATEKNTPEKVKNAVAAARASGGYVVAYSDKVEYPLELVPRGDEDGGPSRVRVVALHFCYPTGPGHDPEDTITRIRASAKNLLAHGCEVELCLPFYRQIKAVGPPPVYFWKLAESIDMIRRGLALAMELGIRRVRGFVFNRANGADGVVSRPEFREYAEKIRANYRALPAPHPAPTPAPTPAPSPTPMPTPDPAPALEFDLGQFVAAVPVWADDWRRVHGGDPGPTDVAHLTYGVVVENGTPDVMVTTPRPPRYEYGQFLEMVDALFHVRIDAGGAAPDAGLLAFWGAQLLVEGKPYVDVVTDARTV